jgi:hypothetical protein
MAAIEGLSKISMTGKLEFGNLAKLDETSGRVQFGQISNTTNSNN